MKFLLHIIVFRSLNHLNAICCFSRSVYDVKWAKLSQAKDAQPSTKVLWGPRLWVQDPHGAHQSWAAVPRHTAPPGHGSSPGVH